MEIHDDVLKHKKAKECHIDKLIISLLKKRKKTLSLNSRISLESTAKSKDTKIFIVNRKTVQKRSIKWFNKWREDREKVTDT